MPGPAQIGGYRGRVDRYVDRGGPVGGGDAGSDAEAPLCVDADSERGGELLGVPFRHGDQAKLVAAVPRQCETDQSTAVQRHEVDHLGSSELRGADEVSLVLPILVVGNDDDLPVSEIVNRLLDSTECRHVLGSRPSASRAATYFAMVSASR
jgi:hypothetical protein